MSEYVNPFPLDSSSSQDVFARVRAGDDASADRLFAAARDFLSRTAKNAVDTDLRGLISESDLIQETLLAANQGFDNFDGRTTQQFAAWLRRIFANNLINQYRALRNTQKRDVTKERRIEAGDVPGELIATNGCDTPSHMAIENEESYLLTLAMETLSEEHRKVIELRHREHMPFKEIGERMDRSSEAARVLWYRAFQQLSKNVNHTPPNAKRA